MSDREKLADIKRAIQQNDHLSAEKWLDELLALMELGEPVAWLVWQRENAYLPEGWELTADNSEGFYAAVEESKNEKGKPLPLYLHAAPPERDRTEGDELHGWQVWQNQVCVECPSCGFTMGADHTDDMKLAKDSRPPNGDNGYTCPNCQITIMHHAAPPERDREAMEKLRALGFCWVANYRTDGVLIGLSAIKPDRPEAMSTPHIYIDPADAILGGEE